MRIQLDCMEAIDIEKIVLIGAGNIGSRHLQALALLDREARVQVVDPSYEALAVARERFESITDRTHDVEAEYCSELGSSWKDADVAIIATSSGPRRQVIEWLASNTGIKNMVLEKVIFQSVRDLYEVGELFARRGIRAWVDCARRDSSFYQHLRDEFINEPFVNMLVDGGEWGLGCNSLHMLDLYAFLTGGQGFRADANHLDWEIQPSKRRGYVEFTGELLLNCSRGQLTLRANQGSRMHGLTYIASNHYTYLLDEPDNIARRRAADTDWAWQEMPMDMKPVSRLTQSNVSAILSEGTCMLPEYAEAAPLQAVLLQAFTDHLNKVRRGCEASCPIT